ncbi:hypothetical protein IQ06DRAFT_92329 [Phaeosphaeriaceae sp. SRC1lsM3a]|nr:hypothetical protein IQ06DRAFT_92329 [Stagonospora sp. SRC1lsM3a]
MSIMQREYKFSLVSVAPSKELLQIAYPSCAVRGKPIRSPNHPWGISITFQSMASPSSTPFVPYAIRMPNLESRPEHSTLHEYNILQQRHYVHQPIIKPSLHHSALSTIHSHHHASLGAQGLTMRPTDTQLRKRRVLCPTCEVSSANKYGARIFCFLQCAAKRTKATQSNERNNYPF